MDGAAHGGVAAGAQRRPHRALAARVNTFLFRHHRGFGVVCCVALMAWGASGVLHPLIGRLGPQAAATAPPPARLDLHALPEPGEVLRRAGIRQAAGLRLVALTDTVGPRLAWQVSLPGAHARRYLDAADGTPVHDGDVRYAIALARHYSGQPQGAVKRVRLVERFDDDYLPVNRLLPVYRVDFDRPDGLRAYVETSPPRLARLTDDGTAQLGRLFRMLHDWSFLDRAEGLPSGLRVGLQSLLLAATLASAVSGLWMYGFLWRRGTLDRQRRPLRRWHRGVGIAVSVSALGFAASAQWRLLADGAPSAPVRAEDAADLSHLRLPEALRQGLWDSVELGGLDAAPYYRVMAAGHAAAQPAHGHAARLLDATTGTQDDDAERRHALRLAARFSGLDAARLREATPLTRFDGEYRFSHRRLPVWRVASDAPGAAAWYVEPRSGMLAAAIGTPQRLEGWSFRHLHMFHWLDFAGRNVRDAALALFGFGNLVVAALGLWLFLRRYGRRGPPAQRRAGPV